MVSLVLQLGGQRQQRAHCRKEYRRRLGRIACAHDTADTLSERILEVEHRIYPDALRLLASGAVRLEGDVCKITASAASGNFLISPLVGA